MTGIIQLTASLSRVAAVLFVVSACTITLAQENTATPNQAASEKPASDKPAETASDQTSVPTESTSVPRVLIVVGAGGESDYERDFQEAAKKWIAACDAGHLSYRTIGVMDPTEQANDRESDRDFLLSQLAFWKDVPSDDTLWLVMIGHGTSSKQASNFNLQGDDVSVAEIKTALQSVKARVVIAACFSTSGTWVPELAAKNRITIAATKSAAEYNYSRFGTHLAESINDLANDLDHDREVSLLEAFLSAARRTDRFYQDGDRLASEHAIVDDNGDGKGTTIDFYDGLQRKSAAKDNAKVDGEAAQKLAFVKNSTTQQLSEAQLQQRAALESKLEALRARKSQVLEDEFYRDLEEILLQLGRIYLGQSAPPAGSL